MPFETKPITFYSHLEVEDCPETPGIYAWYLYKKVVKIDENLIFLTLDDLSKKGELDPIELSSPVAFKRKWVGTLNLITGSQNEIDSNEVDEDEINENNENTNSDFTKSEIDLIVDKFEQTLSGFFAPIYVGSGENLRTRITHHVDRLRTLESREIDPSAVGTKEFAYRAFKRNILLRDLVFTFLPFGSENSEIRTMKVVQKVEYYLNHINNPRLGRR